MQKTNEPIVNVDDVTRIARGASVEGVLTSPHDIRIDGHIQGSTFAGGKVVFGDKADLIGTLMCGNCDIWGTIKGDIYVKDTASFKASAVVDGHLFVRKLQVEIGAQINGSCRMITEQEYEKKLNEMLGKKNPAEAPKQEAGKPKATPDNSASKATVARS